MLPQYIKQKGDVVYFDGDGELVYYIPENYFDTKNAIVVGEYINLLGLFNYDVFFKNGKNVGMKLLKFPSMFKCKPSFMTKESELLLKNTTTPKAYRLLHFEKGSELICSTKIPKSVANSEKFFNLLLRGNFPENLPYDEIHDLIPENASINGFSYPLIDQMYGIMVSEICRNKNNLKEPFRVSDSKSMIDYKAIPITTVPKYVSPYTSVSSENADEAIANAITNKSYKESPLEKVMMN